jgi:hypothetical protein
MKIVIIVNFNTMGSVNAKIHIGAISITSPITTVVSITK